MWGDRALGTRERGCMYCEWDRGVCEEIRGVLVYVFTCMHAKYTCVWVYRCVLYMCVGVYIYTCTHERHHGCIQIHCVRIGIHAYVSVFVRVCVCIHIYMYGRRVYLCACKFLHI